MRGWYTPLASGYHSTMPSSCIKPLLVSSCLAAQIVLSGCYYAQAARGQYEVLRKREPIEEVIGDPQTPPELADRLRLVQEAREFSINELGLPDNKSYQTYSDVQRDYVVWNVFAAPEFSFTPKQWCYPVAGCVSYRGYFKEDAAEREALKLSEDGFDVHVGGVSAYSTLGRFNDPVLSTMMRWDDVQLASVLFHELAHQLLYVKGDTGFNESFATAVEEFAIERFLRSKDMSAAFDTYDDGKEVRRQLMQTIAAAQSDLKELYSRDISDDDKRQLKQQRIDELTADLRELLDSLGRDASGWLQEPLNNARIASQALYEGRLPEFRIMLSHCEDVIECFYAEARRISQLKKPERDEYLDNL
jgi:predicted aminopeptidase